MIPILLTLALIGVVLYFLEKLPMDPIFITVIRIVVIIFVVLWLVQLFGLDFPVPHWRR